MHKKNRTRNCTKKMNPKGTKMYEKTDPELVREKPTPKMSEKKRPIGDMNPRPLDNEYFHNIDFNIRLSSWC